MQLNQLEKTKFGRLLVLKRNGESKSGNAKWDCLCDCGKKLNVVGSKLLNGNTVSCGCWNKEKAIGNTYSRKHGMYNTRFYHTWESIIDRCTNENNKSFFRYGGRGIKCIWKSFEEFKDEMYKSYLNHYKQWGNKNTQIDRIDNNGNYHKKNCRWATRSTQQNNKGGYILISNQIK